MGVNRDGRSTKRLGQDDAGRLPADSPQLHEFFDGGGNDPIESLDEVTGQLDDRLRFLPVETRRKDDLFDFSGIGLRQGVGVGITPEQPGRGPVDVLVGRLC